MTRALQVQYQPECKLCKCTQSFKLLALALQHIAAEPLIQQALCQHV